MLGAELHFLLSVTVFQPVPISHRHLYAVNSARIFLCGMIVIDACTVEQQMAQIAPKARKMTAGECAEPDGIVFLGKIIRILLQYMLYILTVFFSHWCNAHSETVRIHTRQILSAVQVRISSFTQEHFSRQHG